MGRKGPHCISDPKCGNQPKAEPVKACPKGKYGVLHQYDNKGKGACGCAPVNDPCHTDKGPKGPHCISDPKCGNQPKAKPVKACPKGKYGVLHQYDNKGKGACGCNPMTDPCRTDMGSKGPHCISDPKCGNQPKAEPVKACPKGKYGVLHQYDNKGKGA